MVVTPSSCIEAAPDKCVISCLLLSLSDLVFKPEWQHCLALAPSCLQEEVEHLLSLPQDTHTRQRNRTSLKLTISLVTSLTDTILSVLFPLYDPAEDFQWKF